MKAYVVVYGYGDDYEFDGVFLSKEEAEAYVKKNNQIPYTADDMLCIKEVELNPSSYAKNIVIVQGYYSVKDKKIGALEIGRVSRESMEAEDLENLNGNDIIVLPENYSSIGEVKCFYGRVDVTPCKDPKRCDEYIRDVIMKKIEQYNQKVNDAKEFREA